MSIADGSRDHDFDDDVMAVADAVGVTAAPAPIHPSLRPLLTDQSLDAVLASWSRAAAGIPPTELADTAWMHLDLCDRCGSTGLVGDVFDQAITCPSCGGAS